MIREAVGMFLFLGGAAQLTAQVSKEFFRRPLYFKLIIEQIYHVGIRSLPLVLITAASTGMVMALQFGLGLEKFGGKLYVPKIVSLSIVREMGPVFTSLMLAARVGAGITSEIGSMTVTQQIDAIRALGTSPIKRIVIPRVLATLLTLPLLCSAATITGIYAGMVVGVFELKLDPQFYMQKVFHTITLADYFSGFGKSFFFALFISLTACYFGLNVRGGTQGVGTATTRSVVTSSIFILVGDYFLTKLFWVIETWA
ncbi:MAG: ABC transporter permease [Bdellovibrionales bacterium]|nr:ABC transporter permease [Bdellovibrionales bacterium]